MPDTRDSLSPRELISAPAGHAAQSEGAGVYAPDITSLIEEREAIAAELREREEELRAVVEGTGIATWKWDPVHDRIIYQRNVDVMYGLSGPLETYAQLQPYLHPDDLPRAIAAIEHSLATGDNLEIEYRVLRPDGTTIWVTSVASLVRENGTVAFAGIKMDITERKQTEANLRDSEARYRGLAEGGSKFVWINRPDGYTTYVNPQWTAYTGLTQEQTAGSGWSNVLHPDDRAGVFESHKRAVATGTVHETQLRYKCAADGEYRWFIARSTPLRDENGAIQNWMGVAMDIHAQKQAEAALRESEERFRTMADTAPVLIWMLGLEKECFYVNKSWLDFTGRTAEQEIGDGWTENVHPDDVAHCLDAFIASFNARRQFEMEYRLRRCDGQYRWLLSHGVPRFTPDGEFLGYIGSCIDIEERKQAEQENARLLREAQEASRLKDEFLAVVSHELRTPLNAILGWSHLCNSGDLGADEFPHAMEVIERNARAQAQIVEDILDMARVISGKMRIEIAPFALDELACEVLESVRPAAEAKNIALHTHFAPELPLLPADAGRSRQILWNLLSNAIKFTPKNGQVTVALSQTGDMMELVVSDTGQGIEPNFLPFVFDRFRQADSGTTRRHGGLGLGLSLVRHLVEAHGGSINVRSEGQGLGAVFTVHLPLRAMEPLDARDELPQSGAGGKPLPPEGKLAGARLLVVDDRPDSRQAVSSLLERSGAAVETAGTVEEARVKVRQFTFDVVLYDLAMPDEDGYSFIAWLREQAIAEGRPLPAVALTAYASVQERARALSAGFAAFVLTPIEPDELISTVTRLSDR